MRRGAHASGDAQTFLRPPIHQIYFAELSLTFVICEVPLVLMEESVSELPQQQLVEVTRQDPATQTLQMDIGAGSSFSQSLTGCAFEFHFAVQASCSRLCDSLTPS